jgi:hypothetical protein
MPWLTAAVVVILALYKFLEVIADSFIPASSLFGHWLAGIVYYALVTPFFIAVHRFIVLGEVTRGYRLDWRQRRYQLFFGWAFAVYLLSELPMLMGKLPGHWMITLLAVTMTIFGWVAFFRSIILFPAIAVDAPGATLRQAFEDTSGHGWFAFIVPFIPSGLIVAMVVPPASSSPPVVVLLGLMTMFWITLAVVIASRIYLCFGNRVMQAA